MLMNINIKGLHMNMTPAITDYIHTKLKHLEKFTNKNDYLYIECGRTSEHHKQGDTVYRAEITLEQPKATHFAAVDMDDLYPAIDTVIDDIMTQIKTEKSKRVSLLRRGHTLLKQMLRMN